MLFRGANNYNTGLTSAASGGHESIVRLMLELGATNYSFRSKHMHIILFSSFL